MMISQANVAALLPAHATVSDEARERGNRVGIAVAYHMAAHRYEAARATIDRAERQYLREVTKKTRSSRPLDAHLAEVGLPVRTVNALEESGIFTVEDAMAATDAELLDIANVGAKCVAEIRAACETWLGRRPASQFARSGGA